MPNTVIALKKSATSSNKPSSLANGELAINFADGILYYKHANGTIASVSGTGGSFNYVGTIDANGTLLVSDTPGDIISIYPGNGVTIVGDAVNDRMYVNAAPIGASANNFANTKLANTSGVSFAGDLYFPTGNIGVGSGSSAGYRLYVNGSFAANTKSFVIDHPTKSGMTLRHGSLEGPENGVYVRGKVQGKVIELPDYWIGLVDEDTITVQLTAIGRSQNLYVVEVSNNKVFIDTENHTEPYCYFTIYGERKDVEKLVVEY